MDSTFVTIRNILERYLGPIDTEKRTDNPNLNLLHELEAHFNHSNTMNRVEGHSGNPGAVILGYMLKPVYAELEAIKAAKKAQDKDIKYLERDMKDVEKRLKKLDPEGDPYRQEDQKQ